VKNNFCRLSEHEIKTLPEKYQGLLFSPFQHNVKDGFVLVPTDSFAEMVEFITDLALAERDKPCPSND